MKSRSYATHIATAVATASVIAATAAIATPSSGGPSDMDAAGVAAELTPLEARFDAECRDVMDRLDGAESARFHVDSAMAPALPGPGTAAAIEQFESLGSGGMVAIGEDGEIVTHGELEPLDGSVIDLFGEFEPTAEEQAAHDAEMAALAAHLDALGLGYETLDDGPFVFIEPTDDAGWEALGEFFDTRWEDEIAGLAAEAGVDVDDLTGCFDLLDEMAELELQLFGGQWFGPGPLGFGVGLGADEIQSQTDALRAAFDEAGVEYTVQPVEVIDWDEDDAAANAVAADTFEQLWEDQLTFSDEAWSAEADDQTDDQDDDA